MVVRCKQLQKENTRIWVQRGLTALITVLFLIGMSQPLFTLGAFALTALYILFFDGEDGMVLMFYLLPFGNIFKTSPESTSFYTYLTILMAIKLVLSQRRIKINFLITWVVVLIFQIVGSFGDYRILIKQASLLLLVYGYFQCCKPLLKNIVLALSIGVLVSCAIRYFIPNFPGLEPFMRIVRTYEVSYDLLRFTGLYTDPNYLSLILIVLITAIYGLMRKGQIGNIGWVLCGCMVFFGVQTISKSFFLMLAVAVLFLVVDAVRNRRFLFLAVLTVSLIMIIALVVQGRVTIFNNVLERFFYSDDITTGRTDLIDEYMTFFRDNPLNLLLGSGVAAAPLSGLPHNTYVDFLYFYGVFGTIFFLLSLYFSASPLRCKLSPLSAAPVLCFLVMIMALSYVQMYDFAFVIILVLAVFKEMETLDASQTLGLSKGE